VTSVVHESQTTGRPLVTIGVPAYNSGRFIGATLDCLLAQTHQNIEVVVSDNASTDDTQEIVRRYARLDGRVRYSRSDTNVGAAGNIRRLAGMITGQYFKLTNSDDIVDPEFVAQCVEILESCPDVVLACSMSRLIDMDGNALRNYSDDMHVCESSAASRFARIVLRIRLTNSLQGVGRSDVLRELFLRHGSYDGADMVMLAAVAARGQIHQIPRVMFHRRIHAWSASAKAGDHEATQQYLDPAMTNQVPAYLTRIHCGYLAEALRAPLPLFEKASLLRSAARSLISQRQAFMLEWAAILRASVSPARVRH